MIEEHSQQPGNFITWLSPLLIGLGCGGIIFIVIILTAILFQFFLQLTLAGSAMNTLKFWTDGLLIALIWGSLIAVPLAIGGAILSGVVSGLITWLARSQQKEKV